MKTTGDLPNYKNSFYDLNFEIHDPTGSGFAFHLMETGASDITRVSLSGYEGYLFDHSGHFFGGYQSGVPFNVKVYFDSANETYSHYYNDVLVQNNYDTVEVGGSKVINSVVFDKLSNESSTVSIDVSGTIS